VPSPIKQTTILLFPESSHAFAAPKATGVNDP